LLQVGWIDPNGIERNAPMTLEDVSAAGLCLGSEIAVPAGTLLSVYYPNGQYEGRVVYCNADALGYMIGVQLEPGFRWSARQFKPAHLLQFWLRPVAK
jgi:hypothetical protein